MFQKLKSLLSKKKEDTFSMKAQSMEFSAQFAKIRDEQIQDGTISKQKLEQALQDAIDNTGTIVP